MSRPECKFCGGPSEEFHHLTGRGDGVYLDPPLGVWVCRACHRRDQQLQRAADEFDAVTDPVPRRLLLVAWFFRRLADLGRPLVLSPRLLSALAAMLIDIAWRWRQRDTEL